MTNGDIHTGQSVHGSSERSLLVSTVSTGTYWYPFRGATTVVSFARVMRLAGFGGKRP